MTAIDNKGQLMPEELTKWVRSQYLHLEKDPMTCLLYTSRCV